MSGFAADLWSPAMTPIELAEMALDVVGCKVGIGLGRTFIHLDMRGKLASWAVDDAALTEEEFDRFVWYKCTGRDLGSAAEAARKIAMLRSAYPEQDHAPEPVRKRVTAAQYAIEMAAFARVQTRYQMGAVLLDTRAASIETQGEGAEYVLGFIPAGTIEARSLGIETLLARSPAGYFVYVLMRDETLPEIGMMSQDNQLSHRRALATR